MTGTVLFDLSEFVRNPIRTGIQRVSFEVLRRWPVPGALRPVFIPPGTAVMHALPPGFAAIMHRVFAADGAALPAVRREVAAAAAGRPLGCGEILTARAVLNPEVFYDEDRVRFYRQLAENEAGKVHFIVYDALPWLQPQMFPAGTTPGTMPYLQLLRRIPNLYFISHAARRDFQMRVLRRTGAGHTICPLGADAIGIRPPAFNPAGRRFVCLGTVEPRKNHAAVLDAFDRIWTRGIAAELVFAGRPGWGDAGFTERLDRLAQERPDFVWHRECDDAGVAALITSARATIYASELEGFGLPPLESLALGTPVIAHGGLPSLEMIPDAGQIRLPAITPAALEDAVLGLLDDDAAGAAAAAIAGLRLPVWNDLAAFLARATDGGPVRESSAPSLWCTRRGRQGPSRSWGCGAE